jgi:hypothetical protein
LITAEEFVVSYCIKVTPGPAKTAQGLSALHFNVVPPGSQQSIRLRLLRRNEKISDDQECGHTIPINHTASYAYTKGERWRLSMRIVLLAPPNVEEYYTASLLVRGFKAITLPASVPVQDFPKLMREYLRHDGCLLISDDPNLVEIAEQFELIGKPVWRYLAEAPRAAG